MRQARLRLGAWSSWGQGAQGEGEKEEDALAASSIVPAP